MQPSRRCALISKVLIQFLRFILVCPPLDSKFAANIPVDIIHKDVVVLDIFTDLFVLKSLLPCQIVWQVSTMSIPPVLQQYGLSVKRDIAS